MSETLFADGQRYRCSRCGRRHTLRESHFLRVCNDCYALARKCRQSMREVLYDAREAPRHATKFAPGSPEKIELMRLRHERGRALHHPDDARSHTNSPAGLLQPLIEAFDVATDRLMPGIERFQTETQAGWRARPMVGDKRKDLGVFPTLEKANEALRQFWCELLSLPFDVSQKSLEESIQCNRNKHLLAKKKKAKKPFPIDDVSLFEMEV